MRWSHTVPKTPASAWPQIPGFIHYEQERYEAYGAWAEDGLALDPEAPGLHEHRFIYRALHGDWKRAWQDWEFRTSRQSLVARFSQVFPKTEWTGAPIPGKTLLVICENGLGDQIMFSRWLDHARTASSARRVLLETRRELRRWRFGAVEWLTVIANGENLPEFDYWIGLESLPLATGMTVPFPVGVSRVASRVKQAGVCWHGGARSWVDQRRSTPFRMWLPLLQTPDIRFRSLQYGEEFSEGMEPLGPVTDMADTAARMEDLDLVITVDTSVAHVAGAMGIPVWMLHYRPPEWRWGLAGESTDWYRSMRVFRQERKGEWGTVFDLVQSELRKVAV